MATNPSEWETYTWKGTPTEALPTQPDMASDEWDNPTAEPVEDINAQLMDLASDSERQAVYLAPDQQEDRSKNPLGSVVIEDFDGKGGKLIARDQEVADKALQDQTDGKSLQEIIGGLTLAGDGKPSNPDAIVVQKLSPDGAVMRESVQATQADAEAKGNEWGGGADINFTDMPSAVKRRKDLIMNVAGETGLSGQLVAGVMAQESGGDRYAESPAGAQGLMQLMPGTAKDMGVTDVWNEEQNVRGGAKYLRQMLDKYEGNRDLMLAAYNWGPGNLDRHLASLQPGADWKEGLPAETANYVATVGAGGMSEALAHDMAQRGGHTDGFAIPTDESIAGAVDTVFDKNIPYLADDPVLGQLDWQDAQQQQGRGQGQPEHDPDQWEMYGPKEGVKEDDYGWGIKNAFMRGLIRAGSLIDIAQGDTEEYAEGMAALEKYEVSEHDAERLAELQESEGFWDALGYYIVNPALAMQVVVESLPMSAAPLAGGVAGGVAGTATAGPGVGTAVGAALGAGLGSFGTEYLASLGDALQEHGVDVKNPEALKAAFADDAFMETARAHAAKRGIGVAAFDALSMGIAGRIYKPVKGLAGAATKTGAVVGGTTEIIAQGTAGALGERSAQAISGEEYDPAAVAGEFIGELVPGVAEIGINKALGRDAGGSTPDTTPPTTKPKVKRNPDGSWSEVEPERGVPDDIDTSIPDTGDVDVDAEATDRQVETPPPESETATTSPTPTDETAPTKAQEETSSEVVEETPVEELLAAAANEEQAAEEAAAAAETESPLIDAKALGPKVTATINDNEAPGPVRTAWRGLMTNLAKRYPETGAKVPSRTFSGTGVAKFFKQLQEDVDLTKDLPELKAFLDEVTTGKPAEVIQALERLTSQVQGSIPSLTDAPIDSVAGQVQAEYNTFMDFYEKAKTAKGGKNRNKINLANQLGELAAAVKAAVDAADKAGVLESAGLPADFNDTLNSAFKWSDKAQAPIVKRTKTGSSKTIQANRKSLLAMADKLVAIAEKVTPKLAEAEATVDKKSKVTTSTTPKKVEVEAKVAPTSSVTEAPAKPKKAEAAKKTSKGKAEKKASPETPHKDQSVADWVRSFVRPGRKMGVTAGTQAAIEENLKILEKAKHPEAALLRKQIEKTKFNELKPASATLSAGTEVMYKPSKWRMTFQPTAKGKVAQLDTSPIVGGFDTKQAAMAHARAIKKELGGGTFEVIKDPDFVAPKPKKAAAAKAKKPDVKGAKPEEVFDPQAKPTVGRRAAALAAEVEEEGPGALDRALEKVGVSKAAMKKLNGIMGSVNETQQQEIIDATYEYIEKRDIARLVTQIHGIVKGLPSPEVMDALTEFALAIDNNAQESSVGTEDAMDFLSEDDLEIARMTGAIDDLNLDPDERADVDEYGTNIEDKLYGVGEVNEKLPAKDRIRILKDRRQITAALDKIRIELGELTESIISKIKPAEITMQGMVELLLEVMPENHRYTHLLKLLAKQNIQIPIRLKEDPYAFDKDGHMKGRWKIHRDEDGRINVDKSDIELIYNEDIYHDEGFIRMMLHEMMHAASALRFYSDDAYAAHVTDLWLQSVEAYAKTDPDFPLAEFHAKLEKHGAISNNMTEFTFKYLTTAPADVAGQATFDFYGLVNPLEFISESFTKAPFQKFLGETQVRDNANLISSTRRYARRGGKFSTVLVSFLGAVKSFMGISGRNSILNEILFVTELRMDNITSYKGTQRIFDARHARGERQRGGNLAVRAPTTLATADTTDMDKKVRSNVVNNTADAARDRDSKVKQTFESLADTLKSLPRAINLGFMNRDVIERNYRKLFDRASKAAGHAFSPLTQYIKAKQSASRLAEKYAVRATAALQRLQKLDRKSRAKVLTLMRDTTLAQVWPQVSLKDKMNAHLWSKPDKKGVSKLSPALGEAAKQARKDWLALNKKDPKAAQLLIEMAGLTKEIQDQKRIEALRTVGKTYELDPSIVKQLGKLETKEDIQKMFANMYDNEGNLVDADDTSVRPADTIIDKKDSKEVKAKKKEKLKEWRETRAVAKTAEEIVKGTSINGPYFPLRRYGKYVVSSTDEHNEDGEHYVSFHHTRKEAKRVAAAVQEKHDIPTYVTKKIESMSIPRDVESVTAELTARMGRRKDGVSDHMSKRLQTAMLEIMADNAAYASQLKRHGVDGVAADDMGRAFEEYVFVAKYTLGDLATSYEVHQALKDLKNLQSKGMQDALAQKALSEEDALLVGDVVNELAAQNREDAKDREMSKFQKGVGLIGFFNFLGAPSYWILNATQTLTVTLPYIGAKWGAKGTAAYAQSAKTIFQAMAAAIKSGDRSYEGFKAKLPPAAQRVVAEMEAQGIIQSTIAHQFGDIMTPSTLTSIQEWAGPVGKTTAVALKLMETIPEGVEKYNRISTALAIYNLSGGNLQAVADGVQATQFNYDSANRARLMKAAPGWAGGGLRAVITPMMMFKSYGIGLSRLLYGGMMDAALKKGGRVEAAKLAGGLIVSHSVFGGVAGGMMMAPVQAMIWAFNQAFREAGDEFDPEEAVELYLQDVANDTVAALVSRGVPAAAGVDMSKSINLGNLLWMGNDRINMSDAGGVETAITTALGPVAQWSITSVREGHRLWSGDPRGNWFDFAAAAIPLKMARGTIRGLKYEMEGIGTDTLTFVEPEDVTGWIRSAMGFRPTNVAMTTDFEYNTMARDARRSRRKSQLIDRALKAATSSERADVWREIESFNRSLEKRSDWINRGDVATLRSRRRSRQRQYDRERR